MTEYKFNKKENEFTENGHTMFGEDVLKKLKKLAHLEEQMKKGLSSLTNSVSGFKPLSVGTLDKIKEDVYKEQFFDYEQTIDAKEVLNSLQNLKDNPTLLDYVLKCLREQKLRNGGLCVVINIETIPEYKEKIHQTFELYEKHVINGGFGKKKRDVPILKVFHSLHDLKEAVRNYDTDNECKFEKYTIHEIGV